MAVDGGWCAFPQASTKVNSTGLRTGQLLSIFSFMLDKRLSQPQKEEDSGLGHRYFITLISYKLFVLISNKNISF